MIIFQFFNDNRMFLLIILVMFYFELVISRLNQGHKFVSLWLLRATLYK